jgi:hypothetical protein
MGYAEAIALQPDGRILQQAGAVVRILKRGCYNFSTRTETKVKTGPSGEWAARVRPGSRTIFQAVVEGEKSAPIAVQVRPGVALIKVSGHLFQARVLAAHSLAGKVAVLQRYRAASRRWVGGQRIILRRIAKRGSTVVSGRTFSAQIRAGQRLRLIVRQADRRDCYATAASPAIGG